MEFLHSNLPPMKSGNNTFLKKFYNLVPQASEMDIAVGYVTADSLVEMQKLMELNANLHRLNLVIGMHYWEHFTKSEYNAAMSLNDFLMQNKCGEVRVVIPFRYHGKLYSYSNEQGAFAGIIGSNNLSSIVDGGPKSYESSLLLEDKKSADEMKNFIRKLSQTSTENIKNLSIKEFRKENPVLADHDNVRQLTAYELALMDVTKPQYSFNLPIKTYEEAPGSNINAFFGEGRKNRSTGLVRSRPWYEVELIIPTSIATRPGYPVSKTPEAEFRVFTDDGWSFECKVSGQNNKNFRSKGDLEILGKWLKGCLEAEGVLKPGDKVTRETLEKYGRNYITLSKLEDNDEWFLDFGVRK